jgi:hypothetical protein
VPRLIVPTDRRTDPVLPGFLGIRLLARYLPQRCDYHATSAITPGQVSRETMLASTAFASWSTSAAEVSKAVIQRRTQLPSPLEDQT